MKILNIDAFAAPKRELLIDGQKHPVKDIDVQSFIDALKQAENLEKTGERTPVEMLEGVVDSIIDAIPTLSPERVRKLSPEQMGKVLEFIRGDLDNLADKPAEGSETSAEPVKS